MKWCVYKHETPDCKVYIGATSQSIEDRWKAGYHGGRFSEIVAEYGWEGMSHEVICDDLDFEQASR